MNSVPSSSSSVFPRSASTQPETCPSVHFTSSAIARLTLIELLPDQRKPKTTFGSSQSHENSSYSPDSQTELSCSSNDVKSIYPTSSNSPSTTAVDLNYYQLCYSKHQSKPSNLRHGKEAHIHKGSKNYLSKKAAEIPLELLLLSSQSSIPNHSELGIQSELLDVVEVESENVFLTKSTTVKFEELSQEKQLLLEGNENSGSSLELMRYSKRGGKLVRVDARISKEPVPRNRNCETIMRWNRSGPHPLRGLNLSNESGSGTKLGWSPMSGMGNETEPEKIRSTGCCGLGFRRLKRNYR